MKMAAPPLLMLMLIMFLTTCSLDINFPRRVALVYGAAIYDDENPEDDGPSGPNLIFTNDDAAKMAVLLKKKGFTVFLRIDDGTGNSPTEIPAVIGLEDSFTWSEIKAANSTQLEVDFSSGSAVMNSINSDTLFLFYYSGHGWQDNNDEYIILVDQTWQNGVGVKTFANYMKNIPSNKKIVIADSCHSGGLVGETFSVDAYPKNWDGKSLYPPSFSTVLDSYLSSPDAGGVSSDTIVISASGSDEYSYELSSTGGLFTYGLLDAVSEGDSNSDGFITVQELYTHSRDIVLSYKDIFNTSTINPAEGPYLPHISGSPVDFVLFEAD